MAASEQIKVIYALWEFGGVCVKFGRCRSDRFVGDRGRVHNLQTGNPRELVVLAVVDWPDEYEYKIHQLLRDHRIRDEWFYYNDKSRSVVALMAYGEVGREDLDAIFAANGIAAKRLGPSPRHNWASNKPMVAVGQYGAEIPLPSPALVKQ